MISQESFRLVPRTGWRVAASEGIAFSAPGAMLAPRPGAMRPLDDPGGDLGGRAMPRRVAPGPGGLLYLITADGQLVYYDPCLERFAPIPCGTSGRLGLAEPVALAVTPRGELLVLDGQSRMITALSLADWRIIRQVGPFAVTGDSLRPVAPRQALDPATGRPLGIAILPPDAWSPRDIAALPDGRVAVSEAATGRIALFDGRGCLVLLSDGATAEESALRSPDALAVAADGALFVLEAGPTGVARLDASLRIVARTRDAADLPDPIEATALVVDPDGTIWISSRRPDAARPLCCDPSNRISGHAADPLTPRMCQLLAFDTDGRAILGTPERPCLQRSDHVARLERGRIDFARLDGGREATVWDRVRLDLEIPAGTSARLLCFGSDAAFDAATVAAMPDTSWTATPLSVRDGEAVAALRAPPGRYLWLRIALGGDGAVTPVLRALTVTYPRRSSARHLPAAWSADPVSADFLQRFMMLFDEVRADALRPLDALDAYIDPMATPAAGAGLPGEDFLDWLGGWIGIALDRDWPVERRRRLVAEAPSLFRIKGTVEGLRRHVEIYTGLSPRIVEHYRLRRWMTLDESRLDGLQAIWGPDLVRRLELDGHAEIGRFSLVDGGDPLTDPFAAFAHRATVYVAVAEGFADRDLAALEAVVEGARPAHVSVDVRVMKPRFVLGCDTLLGVNTILGGAPGTAVTDETVLGEDIRLAGPPHAFTLGPGTRLGPDTTLT